MDLVPRRRWSREIPPDLSELMDKLINHAASFIREFDSSEHRMREIVEEFRKIADEVRKMQKTTDEVRRRGAVFGGVGIGLLVFLAPFTGGASLAGVTAAAGGGALVVGANVAKAKTENRSIMKVEQLGKDFMKIVEPLKKNLEEIKWACEKLEQRSAEVQAENTLTDMLEFQRIIIIRRVSELAEKTGVVLSFTAILIAFIQDLLLLFVKVFRVTATPEEDKKLKDSIIQSADRCQEVVVKFDQMKEEVKDFSVKFR